jgi:hypothetical protein
LPLPLAPDVIVSHCGLAVLVTAAVHPQTLLEAVSATLPLPAPAAMVALAGAIEYVQ